MSKKSKTVVGRKANSKKVNKFKTTPLITVVAIVEVIVLIASVTFAWFKLAENNSVESGLISVAPDSGLQINFHEADKSSYIDIRNYLHDFTFEPCTSLDGRNLYFPTTGTFEHDATKDIVFREGTVNDCNSKYIAVDFELTNSSTTDTKDVYLDNRSTFDIKGSDNANPSGKALRIAFYQNDNKSGKVNSAALTSLAQEGADVYTIFFYDSLGWIEDGEVPYAHIWHENGSNDENYNKTSWPGIPMKHISGELYYLSFRNVGGDNNQTGYYDYVVFNDGDKNTTKRTEDLEMQENHLYTPSQTKGDHNYHNADSREYTSLTSTSEGYAVIAPGVSAGFQRPYAPVTEINNTTGKATMIVPAYAYSIDEYFSLDSAKLFSIGPEETQSLTMIIWLEGTDPDCTDDPYSGSMVDLRLEFSVVGGTDTDRQPTYFYQFYDYTKETWVDDEIKDNGLVFKPVMQLYDVDKGRGYLMHKVANTEDTLWQVEAPQDITADRLEFRRVNPNNEQEIWNVWDASEVRVNQIKDVIMHTVGEGSNRVSYIPFTAFADGAPSSASTSDYYLSAGASASAPAHSCGGLWGYHPVTLFTFVDGTDGIYLHNSDTSSTKGIVTLEYTYHFSNGVTQTIEYKASGPDYGVQFFRFVVPKDLVDSDVGITRVQGEEYNSAADGSSTPTYRFKRYYHVDGDFAINIPFRNPDIVYDKTFTINGTMKGTCAMTTGNTNYDVTYFGRQLAYVQVRNYNYDDGTRSDMFTDSAKMLAVFWSDYYRSNKIMEVKLRTANGSFEDSTNNYSGFAVAVPYDTHQWAIWRCNYNWSEYWSYPQFGKEGINFEKEGEYQNATTYLDKLYKVHSFVANSGKSRMYVDKARTDWPTYGNYE